MPYPSEVGLQAEGAEKGTCKHCIQMRKRMISKKGLPRYLWISNYKKKVLR